MRSTALHYWKKISSWQYTPFVSVLGISALYLLVHLWKLQALPIFADEAIYIRWPQLIQHEPQRYLFFALNDGKPPLFIWILSSLLSVFPQTVNAVWIARFTSVMIGLFQLWAIDRIVKELRGTLLTRIVAGTIVFTAPFWTFYHRLALMDGLVTLLLSLSFWGLIGLHHTTLERLAPTNVIRRQRIFFTFLAGLSWGTALWTKTPALFFAPVFLLFAYGAPFLLDSLNWKKIRVPWLLHRTAWFALAGSIGCGVFLLLKLSPSFGSLFGRSSDFTYSISEVISMQGINIWKSLWRVFPWISTYLRPELVALSLIAVVVSRYRRVHWFLWLSAFIFAAPLLILGKTLHPRYFLPMAPFLTVSAALIFHEAWVLIQKKSSWEMLLVFLTLSAFYLVGSLRFLFFSYYDPNLISFVADDREQYLTEWSSGHGLAQTRDRIQEKVHDGEYVTVITEGSFGSLPDGLLVYFDRLPEIESVRIEGLAQYPVKSIPDWAWEAARDHTTWLVVNEHRISLPQETLDQLTLEADYPRPYGAPSLQIYELHPKEE